MKMSINLAWLCALLKLCIIAILFFPKQIHTQNDPFMNLSVQLREFLNESKSEQTDEDKLFDEVYTLVGQLYKKLVEITALYYSGYSYDDEKIFHERLIFEVGKNLVLIIKALALYIPTLLKNQKISWKIKAKKSLLIASIIIFCMFWVNEYYRDYKEQQVLMSNQRFYNSRDSMYSDFDFTDFQMFSREKYRPSRPM